MTKSIRIDIAYGVLIVASVTQVFLICLKLFHFLDKQSWWAVFTPVIVIGILAVVLILFGLIIAFIAGTGEDFDDHRGGYK